MLGGEGGGNVKTKPKTNKKPKQNWKTLKPTEQGGLPASIPFFPRTSILRGQKLTTHYGVLGAWLRTCTEPASTSDQVPEGWRTEQSPLPPKLVNHVPRWHTRAPPGDWSRDKTGKFCTTKRDELMFSSWKSQGKHPQTRNILLTVFFIEFTSDYAKRATCSELQNFSCRWQVWGLKKYFISQGKRLGKRFISCSL